MICSFYLRDAYAIKNRFVQEKRNLNPFGVQGHPGNWKFCGKQPLRTGFAEEGVKINWY